jgi:Serine dehydratase alpha chain
MAVDEYWFDCLDNSSFADDRRARARRIENGSANLGQTLHPLYAHTAPAAALIAQAMDSSPQVIENAAESALEHHLGMTCDPVGLLQVPASTAVPSAP